MIEINKEQIERLEKFANKLWEEIEEGCDDIKVHKLYTDTAFRLVRYHAAYDNKEDTEECILDRFVKK
jgi:hypothetical protein